MSEESNPYIKMTEEELVESCAIEDGAQRAIKLVQDWLRSRRDPPPTAAKKRRQGASTGGRCEEGHNRLFNDYFSDNPVYTDDQFRKKFRMRRRLFLRIVEALQNHSEYFQTTSGLSTLQKCTAAIRMLAHGVAVDIVDEYAPIGESTTIECVQKFVSAVVDVFGDEYLRKPNGDDVRRLMDLGERRGFPGMMGSIDFMHWEWKNCPGKWKSLYLRGDQGKPIITLEMVASEDLWIWHAFFGCPRSNDNLDVFGTTPALGEVYEGRAPQFDYAVNGRVYRMGYYLTDGIYPEYPTFVKAVAHPQQPKEKLFTECHEEARKDVERAFRMLQARFAIVRGPGRVWDRDTLRDIICACVILHNMIVEDEKDISPNDPKEEEYDSSSNDMPMPEVSHSPLPDYETYLQTAIQIHDHDVQHHQLQADLVEHLWQRFGRHS